MVLGVPDKAENGVAEADCVVVGCPSNVGRHTKSRQTNHQSDQDIGFHTIPLLYCITGLTGSPLSRALLLSQYPHSSFQNGPVDQVTHRETM